MSPDHQLKSPQLQKAMGGQRSQTRNAVTPQMNSQSSHQKQARSSSANVAKPESTTSMDKIKLLKQENKKLI